MNYYINKTQKGVIKYPTHKHSYWEIMFYTSGTGIMSTAIGNYPFKKGTIILIPPYLAHGSVSEKGFINISIGGDFDNLFLENKPYILESCNNDGCALANMIYDNQYGDENYRNSLIETYTKYILKNIQLKTPINNAVYNIIQDIINNYNNCNYSVITSLLKSDYAEDYIRYYFKKLTKLTPTQFLIRVRLDNAINLMNIYGNILTLNQIAEHCGFLDYFYFSRLFNKYFKTSPRQYLKKLNKQNNKKD